MKNSPIILSLGLCLVTIFTLVTGAEKEKPEVTPGFETIQLDDKFHSERAAFGDFNQDGHNDIAYGPYWFEGPSFHKRNHIYKPLPFAIRKYSENFFTYADDLDADGLPDLLVLGFPAAKRGTYWYKNPGKGNFDKPWPRFDVFDGVENESPVWADVNGDGKKEVLCSIKGQFGFVAPADRAQPEKPWKFTAITPPNSTGGKFTHGLGFGDLNGDDRADLLEKTGWWEQPADDSLWTKHPYVFSADKGGCQMFADDFDGDGDQDVITAINAHGYGLDWFEQIPGENGGIDFKRHNIMGKTADESPVGIAFSQLHGMALADMDGDGIKDIITGKRYFAHGGKDPGGKDPAVLYWFRTKRNEDGNVSFDPHLIHDDSGVGVDITVGDIDGDGRLDVLTGNKKGCFLHRQTGKSAALQKPAAGLKEGNALEAEPQSPEAQRAAFRVPEGFEVELVASEETGVPKPVSLAFDDAGRLWTQTATAYPRDRDPKVWQEPGPDRIVVIDQPHLAEPQTPRVFASDMVMPMGVLPWENGAIVAQGPEILRLEDTNGDGAADKRTVLLKGFGVQDTHTLPHQLVRLPGQRIGFSQGVLNGGTITDASGKSHPFDKTLIASFAPDGTDLQTLGVGMNNIWAWAEDRLGRVFIHEANDWGYSLVPFERDSSYPSFVSTSIHPDAPVHPPTAQDLGLGGTGFSGIAICDDRSGSFQEPWKDSFFIANPILGKINAASGTVDENGVWTFTKMTDLVTCDDPMFRPVAVAFGPDGCLYIADWYNRIISHNEVSRDHPARDKSHGRIWRIRAKGQPHREPTDFTKLATQDLPNALNSDSSWAVQAALNQISQRQDKSIIPTLITKIQSADDRIALLRALENLGHFDPELWTFLLQDSEPNLRRELARSLTTLGITQEIASPILQTLANESAWTVRYEVLRYFRQMEGEINSDNLTWLNAWSNPPAPTNQVDGPKGKYLALDGSYQRAFQDFLLKMAKTKTSLPVLQQSKWNKVIARHQEETDKAALAKKSQDITLALKSANPADGKTFVQALCLTCHAINGEGVGFAPPLDGFAARDLDGAITAIIQPNAAMENVFRNYRIELKDGTVHEGFKQSESRREITLLTMGGAPHTYPVKKIKNAGFIDGQSVMPDLTTSLTPEQIASIIAYLKFVDGNEEDR